MFLCAVRKRSIEVAIPFHGLIYPALGASAEHAWQTFARHGHGYNAIYTIRSQSYKFQVFVTVPIDLV